MQKVKDLAVALSSGNEIQVAHVVANRMDQDQLQQNQVNKMDIAASMDVTASSGMSM